MRENVIERWNQIRMWNHAKIISMGILDKQKMNKVKYEHINIDLSISDIVKYVNKSIKGKDKIKNLV